MFAGATDGLRVEDGESVIRGLSITRWNGAAIRISGGSGSTIEGNFLGLTPAGLEAPNTRGIEVAGDGFGVQIGGPAAADRNVISGNAGAGIRLVDADSVSISGNLIGTSLSGIADAGNAGWGVEITGTTIDTTVGGSLEAANVIAFNSGGVRVDGATLRNSIIGNRMFSNDGPGIDLGAAGMTPNDQGDLDLGPNFAQNFPEIDSVYVSNVTGQAMILGRQDSNDLAGMNRIDFYIADTTAAGYGEGRTWIGSLTGLPAGTFDLPGGPFLPHTTFSAGAMITATATTNDGTSEFSANVATVLNQRPVATTGADQIAPPKKFVTLDGSASSDADDLPGTLTYTWEQKSGKEVTLSDPHAPSPTFTPTQGGEYKFELTVHDGLDISLPKTTIVSITDDNPPTASALSTSATGGIPRSLRLRASDLEATEFTYAIVSPPQFGTISGLNPQTGALIYTAYASYSGVDSFTFTAHDGQNLSTPATVTINVAGGLLITTGVLPNVTIGRSYAVAAVAQGGNGVFAWNFTGGTLPPGMTFTEQGLLTGNATTPGDYEFGVQVTDGNGLKSQRTVYVTVLEEPAWAFRLFAMFVTTNDD